MRTCENCGKEFPIWVRINGERKSLANRKYCLECSPWGVHNTKILTRELRKGSESIKYNSISDIDPNRRQTCSICGEEKSILDFYIKKYGTNIHVYRECKRCFSKRTGEMKVQNRLKAIEYKGGKCQNCGYDRNKCALDFHHLDSEEKESNINKLLGRSFENLKKELDKCILLCANCHRETHNPKWTKNSDNYK